MSKIEPITLDTPPLDPLEILLETRSFAGLEREPLQALVDSAARQVFSSGETLYWAGEPFRGVVYIPYTGKLLMRRSNGEESEIQPGDFIGLANYLDNAPYASTVYAMTRSKVLAVPAEDLRRLERQYPELFNVLSRVIANKLRERSPNRGITTGALAQSALSAMKSPVATCGPEVSLAEAFEMMQARKIGSLVVTDEADKLIGVLTFAGISEALLNGARPDTASRCRVCHHNQPV